MKTITVNVSNPYTVTVGEGLLSKVGDTVKKVLPRAQRIMLVTDDTVQAFYADTATKSLQEAGFDVSLFSFPAGEASKSTDTLLSLWNALATHQFSRTDAIVALGGGVVGDLAGFAAATYLRGISCFQIPTTLLAMVDSSVGGKTAVNLEVGKNLCGAFSQPVGVLCDTALLKTLPEEIFADGCAEVLKYGYIGDSELLSLLETSFQENPEEVIARCISAKARIVEADEHDNGERQLLNFGHTVGHAIEKLSHFEISHGSAVAMGMKIVTDSAVAAGLCEGAVATHLESLLKVYHLPTVCPFGAEEMAAVAMADKKRRGDTVTLVIPDKLGHCRLSPMAAKDIAAFLKNGGLAP